MIKLTISINPNLGKFESDLDLMGALYATIPENVSIRLDTAIDDLTNSGDIWFKHSELTESKDSVVFNFILDSDDASKSFSNTVMPIITEVVDSNSLDISIDQTTLTFEQFAEFASSNEESEFIGTLAD